MTETQTETSQVMTDALVDASALAAPKASPELADAVRDLAAVGANQATTDQDTAPTGAPMPRALDANNPNDKWIMDILGEPFSAIIYGKNKVGKTQETLRAFPRSLLVTHSKATLRTYANMARKYPDLFPKPTYIELPQYARDPKTGHPIRETVKVMANGKMQEITRFKPNNIEQMLRHICNVTFPAVRDKNPDIEGIIWDEVTVFMGWMDTQGKDPTICPQFQVEKDGNMEPNGWALNKWMLELLMWSWRAAPNLMNGYMIQLGNERDPRHDDKTGVTTLGGPELVTKTQTEKGSHEVDYMLRVVKTGDMTHDIVSTNSDQYRAGSRAGDLVLPREVNCTIRDWFLKAGVLLD